MSNALDPTDMAELFRRLAAPDRGASGEIARRLWSRLRPAARRRLRREPELATLYDEEDEFHGAMTVSARPYQPAARAGQDHTGWPAPSPTSG